MSPGVRGSTDGASASARGPLSGDQPTAADRLRLLEKLCDPGTTDVLARIGVEPDWNCLELGAGAGSIAYWLADRTPRGRVVAVDLDPRFIDADRAPHLTVSAEDIAEQDHPAGSFQLIHARSVFLYLPRREEIVERAVRWLAPGGWLLLEDVRFLPASQSPHPARRQVNGAWLAALAKQGIDLTWADRVPEVLADAGLEQVRVSVAPGPGVDTVQGELLRLRAARGARNLDGAGPVSAPQAVVAGELLSRLPTPDVPTSLHAVWGRKPMP
ncbi:class I SAM-dependent methyltransferase [Streptomyces sp. NPDC002018]|uniref:class I SAM-dependent methyltransferase n=1 Tax=Streptomyces sp. NPDC002018 TaxID=3364629 RepID=UPI0036A9B2FC